MIARLIIPVIDTESISFDTNVKLTADQYREMVYDNFRKNDYAINNYMVNGRKSYYGNGYAVENSDAARMDVKYDDIEVECMFCDVQKNDISDKTLIDTVNSGKMNLLLMNINPNDVDPDAESEIRFWLDDSQRVLDDETLDDASKIKFLPKRTLQIKTNDNWFILDGCKMVENRSCEQYPYYFAVIIEKTYFNK